MFVVYETFWGIKLTQPKSFQICLILASFSQVILTTVKLMSWTLEIFYKSIYIYYIIVPDSLFLYINQTFKFSSPFQMQSQLPTALKNYKTKTFITSCSEGLVDDTQKSKPIIFQAPLLFKIIFSGVIFPWTIFTLLCKNDNPSETYKWKK